MIEASQVHQLVHDHVVADELGHREEPPVQGDMPVATARSPAGPLIADRDARHPQRRSVRAADVREIPGERCHPVRQLDRCTRPQLLTVIAAKRRWREARPLPFDPVQLPLRERVRLAFRTASRDGDAHATVGVDPYDVAPRAAMPHEIELQRPRPNRKRRLRTTLPKRQRQLHDERILRPSTPDSQLSYAPVNSQTPRETFAPHCVSAGKTLKRG